MPPRAKDAHLIGEQPVSLGRTYADLLGEFVRGRLVELVSLECIHGFKAEKSSAR